MIFERMYKFSVTISNFKMFHSHSRYLLIEDTLPSGSIANRPMHSAQLAWIGTMWHCKCEQTEASKIIFYIEYIHDVFLHFEMWFIFKGCGNQVFDYSKIIRLLAEESTQETNDEVMNILCWSRWPMYSVVEVCGCMGVWVEGLQIRRRVFQYE